ncbi:MAG: hypothetical protein AB1523_12740 [Bacillota bacterium]
MKRFQLKKSLRMAIIIINALLLIIWSGWVFFWYEVIMSDIPPAPTIRELHDLERFVIYWFLILIENIVFLVFTTNKTTQQ